MGLDFCTPTLHLARLTEVLPSGIQITELLSWLMTGMAVRTGNNFLNNPVFSFRLNRRMSSGLYFSAISSTRSFLVTEIFSWLAGKLNFFISFSSFLLAAAAEDFINLVLSEELTIEGITGIC